MVSARGSVLESLFEEEKNFSQAFSELNKGRRWLSGGQPPGALSSGIASAFLEGAEIIL